jgi:hypothetical protein
MIQHYDDRIMLMLTVLRWFKNLNLRQRQSFNYWSMHPVACVSIKCTVQQDRDTITSILKIISI